MVVGICTQSRQPCDSTSQTSKLTSTERLVPFSVPLLVNPSVRPNLCTQSASSLPTLATSTHLSIIAVRLSLVLALTALQAAIALRSNPHQVPNLDMLHLASNPNSVAHDLVPHDLVPRVSRRAERREMRTHLGVVDLEPSAREDVQI